jgi:hypothetical protein
MRKTTLALVLLLAALLGASPAFAAVLCDTVRATCATGEIPVSRIPPLRVETPTATLSATATRTYTDTGTVSGTSTGTVTRTQQVLALDIASGDGTLYAGSHIQLGYLATDTTTATGTGTVTSNLSNTASATSVISKSVTDTNTETWPSAYVMGIANQTGTNTIAVTTTNTSTVTLTQTFTKTWNRTDFLQGGWTATWSQSMTGTNTATRSNTATATSDGTGTATGTGTGTGTVHGTASGTVTDTSTHSGTGIGYFNMDVGYYQAITPSATLTTTLTGTWNKSFTTTGTGTLTVTITQTGTSSVTNSVTVTTTQTGHYVLPTTYTDTGTSTGTGSGTGSGTWTNSNVSTQTATSIDVSDDPIISAVGIGGVGCGGTCSQYRLAEFDGTGDLVNSPLRRTGTNGLIADGTLQCGGDISTSGNVSGVQLTSSGNTNVGGTLMASGAILATGAIQGANLTALGHADQDLLHPASVCPPGQFLTTNGSNSYTICSTPSGTSGGVSCSGSCTANKAAQFVNSSNITDAPITFSGSNAAVSNNLSAGGTVSATGTVSGSNLTTSGAVTATGTVSGSNLTTSGAVTATGTVSGSNLTSAGHAAIDVPASHSMNIRGINVNNSLTCSNNTTSWVNCGFAVATYSPSPGTAYVIANATVTAAGGRCAFRLVNDYTGVQVSMSYSSIVQPTGYNTAYANVTAVAYTTTNGVAGESFYLQMKSLDGDTCVVPANSGSIVVTHYGSL